MGTFSLAHWLVVLAVVLVVFGPGRLSGMMGDLGKGIKSFRQGMAEDEKSDPAILDDKPSDKA
jgi:sec-independent protein translocase protein TatA